MKRKSSRLLLLFCALFACLFLYVITHKAIEDLIIGYYYAKVGTEVVATVECEGRHPIKNFHECKPLIIKTAETSGILWYLYHKEYGTEAKRETIKLDMCRISGSIERKFSILKHVHENPWTPVCGVTREN